MFLYFHHQNIHLPTGGGRSGEIVQGVTNFQNIPNIYDTEEAFQGENDSINFLNKYGDVDEYGFYKASLITSPSGTINGRIPSIGEFMVMINASENNISVIMVRTITGVVIFMICL